MPAASSAPASGPVEGHATMVSCAPRRLSSSLTSATSAPLQLLVWLTKRILTARSSESAAPRGVPTRRRLALLRVPDGAAGHRGDEGVVTFPTSGWADPTLTAMALSLRPADHLR